jgi:hypothetical protein
LERDEAQSNQGDNQDDQLYEQGSNKFLERSRWPAGPLKLLRTRNEFLVALFARLTAELARGAPHHTRSADGLPALLAPGNGFDSGMVDAA